MWDFFSRRQRCDGLLTQQEQFHFSGRLLSIFSQVFINHFGPLRRGFVFLTNCTAHGSQCALQDCCLVGKYHLGEKQCLTGESENPLRYKASVEVGQDDFPFWRVPTNVTESVHPRGETKIIQNKRVLSAMRANCFCTGKKNTKSNAGCSVGHWWFLMTVQKLYGRILADF